MEDKLDKLFFIKEENDISNRDAATLINMNLSFQTSYILSILLAVGTALVLAITTSHTFQAAVFAVWTFEVVNCIRKRILLELMVKKINQSSGGERETED